MSLTAGTCALGAVLVTRVQVLPDVIDLTFILTSAGFGGLVLMALGVALRMTPDRLGRVTVLGQLLGAVAGALVLVIAIVAG